MPNSHYDNKVKLVMGQTHTDFASSSDTQGEDKTSTVMDSVRQVFQKPDVSRIQLLSWMREINKSRAKGIHQSGREWSRFMSGYIRSNANGNDVA